MFQSARIKLTLWYVLILMLISMLFSVAFYNSTTGEIERVINRIQFREDHPQEAVPERPEPSEHHDEPTLEDLDESKHQLLILLVFINGCILITGGGAAYFLAGRTLQPIKLMIDEQTQFIASASHELRTPIATMRTEMETNLLEKNISDKRARELIKSNLEELTSLQQLTNHLLTIAHVHSATADTYTTEVKLKDTISTVVKKITPLARKKAITITVEGEEATIHGDKARIREVFVVLFENAIKYSDEKTAIRARIHKKACEAVVTVTDQGRGIDEKDLPHVFERFYRADKSRSETDGYGLGLSIAKKTVETHNGKIEVASELGKGTTFTLRFPLR